jgi:enoyl-CoA hydratase
MSENQGDPAEIRVIRLTGAKAGAMDEAMLDALERQVDDFEEGPARAAVIAGHDRFFSAGLALPKLIDLPRDEMRVFMRRFSRAMTRVLACEKPIVAAVNGHAIAGGCVLALMCDWRICVDEGAKIGLSEAQLGIGLPAIVVEPLRAAVPPASLVPLALEGRLCSPAEARELGLVHELAPAAELPARAEAKARALAAPPAMALAQIKRSLRAPILDAIARVEDAETERWLDSWFSEAAQVRLRMAVKSLGRPR